MDKQKTFGFDKPEDSPGFMLWQTTTTWQRLIRKALDAYGISHSQFVILAVSLWFEQKGVETTQLKIAELSKIDKMTISLGLKYLASKNLVVRKENEEDTRVKSVMLTKTGRTLAARLVPIIEKIDNEFFGVITNQEQKSLLGILQKINT